MPGQNGLVLSQTPVAFVTFSAFPSVQRLVCGQLYGSAVAAAKTESNSRQALRISRWNPLRPRVFLETHHFFAWALCQADFDASRGHSKVNKLTMILIC